MYLVPCHVGEGVYVPREDQGACSGQPELRHNVHDFDVLSLTLDVVQDHPAAWDWRLIFAFIVVGVVSLYFF